MLTYYLQIPKYKLNNCKSQITIWLEHITIVKNKKAAILTMAKTY